MATERNIGQYPDQPHRRNYHEKRAPDGMVEERSWKTPDGTKVTERVIERGHFDLISVRGQNFTPDWINEHLITHMQRIEQKPGSKERFIQSVEFSEHPPLATYGGQQYNHRNAHNPYLLLEGYTLEGKYDLHIRDARRYYRYLYPDGEEKYFYDEEGKPVWQNTKYEKTPEGWKKTTKTEEIDPLLGSHNRFPARVLHQQEEVVQEDQLSLLPRADKPNGFPSLDAIPEEYYRIPPFQPKHTPQPPSGK